MKNKFNWGDNVIDSRDIIKRYEELQDEYNGLLEALDEATSDLKFVSNSDESSLREFQDAENSVAEAQEALDSFNQSYEKDELDTLTEVIAQGEDSPDWSYGETLIRDSYFEKYTEELIEDTCEMPKEFNSGEWPYRHYTLDLESAADDLKQDYSTIEAGGEVYYIRA